ncbi:hypothetical protein ACP70R_049308 [Stipagrostis hirtigluma subsp. patula]
MQGAPMDSTTAQPQHFLFVTSPLHGHINPVRRLAARVLAANPGARVTFSTAISGHRLMFPALASPDDWVLERGGVLHAPFSDGFDHGFDPKVHDARSYKARARAVGGETLSGVIRRLAAERGHPAVTRVVYTFLVGWAHDVARAHGVPAALFWIQPATVFAVYYHYFHGHAALLASSANDGGATVRLPGLPPLRSNALPSIVSVTSPEQPLYAALDALRGVFSALDEHRQKVLVNTFDALEPDALRAVPQLELVAVGPVVPDEASSSPSSSDLFQSNNVEEHMRWLDTKAARSVVYVSFGSLLPMSERQAVEMRRGLEATGRPYLWVCKGGERGAGLDGTGPGQGMVVEWCDQVRVLSHPAVGCFVTHCGWNSTLESITCGVPIVAVPQWTDQPTVAWLVEERAGVGVRTVVDGEGVVECAELRRCIEAVMGGGDRAADVRARVKQWRERARDPVAAHGESHRKFQAFASGL